MDHKRQVLGVGGPIAARWGEYWLYLDYNIWNIEYTLYVWTCFKIH